MEQVVSLGVLALLFYGIYRRSKTLRKNAINNTQTKIED